MMLDSVCMCLSGVNRLPRNRLLVGEDLLLPLCFLSFISSPFSFPPMTACLWGQLISVVFFCRDILVPFSCALVYIL